MSIPISLGILIGIDKNNEIKNFKETIVQYNIYNDYLKILMKLLNLLIFMKIYLILLLIIKLIIYFCIWGIHYYFRLYKLGNR